MHALAGLKGLEALRLEFGPSAARRKIRCLRSLKSARLRTADQVSRLHEMVCFIQAWPDNAAVLGLANDILARFDRREDLRRNADRLADTGIAGTPMHFSFYAATALWLAERWPGRLHVDWHAFENAVVLERYLHLLASYSETPALDAVTMETAEWIERLRGPRETDAVFLLRRLAALVSNGFLHEELYDHLDLPLIVAPGRDTPSRTRARYDRSPIVYQTVPLSRARPSTMDEIRRTARRPRPVSRAAGTVLLDLARSAMVTRQRDLDAFAYADPRDVTVVGDDGLQFALYGVQPTRRFLLETLYGFMTLKNGVPIGYGSVTGLFASAEVSFTIFDTFRGGESARTYLRTLSMVHHVFGCDTFVIDPYQLGADNEDALKSGAWWFYQKLGYRPRDRRLLRLMRRELARARGRRRHRSSRAVLAELATENVYLHLKEQRDDVMGVVDIGNVGLRITDCFARRFGSDREEGEKTLAAEAARRLRVSSFRGWSAAEKLAWRRWSPLVSLLDDLHRWPTAARRDLVQLIRAKGGRRELEYLRRFDAHRRLREAVVKLAED